MICKFSKLKKPDSLSFEFAYDLHYHRIRPVALSLLTQRYPTDPVIFQRIVNYLNLFLRRLLLYQITAMIHHKLRIKRLQKRSLLADHRFSLTYFHWCVVLVYWFMLHIVERFLFWTLGTLIMIVLTSSDSFLNLLDHSVSKPFIGLMWQVIFRIVLVLISAIIVQLLFIFNHSQPWNHLFTIIYTFIGHFFDICLFPSAHLLLIFTKIFNMKLRLLFFS